MRRGTVSREIGGKSFFNKLTVAVKEGREGRDFTANLPKLNLKCKMKKVVLRKESSGGLIY